MYTSMVDKYEAKKYVASIIGEQYIIPTLNCWDRFDDISFDSLPNQFVLKCTHDSGGLVIVKDKSKIDKKAVKKKIEKSLKRNYYWSGREWPYKNVKPKIIAEKYLTQLGDKGLIDYKFFCFNGDPKFVYISKGLDYHPTAQISFYDLNGSEMPFHRNDYKPFHNATLPENFSEMIAVAKKLSQNIGCSFVRIDLYSVVSKIYFSEITFSPCGGYIPFEPKSADLEVGKLLDLGANCK